MRNENLAQFIDCVESVAGALAAIFEPTPLQRNAFLSARFNADIWLKREDLTPVRSYKIRGAYNFLMKALAEPSPPASFACASAGNHAQGFAHACAHFGVPGTIFMPVTTPQQKIMKTKAFGGDAIKIQLTGDTFDESYRKAIDHCARSGAVMVPPFDHPRTIEGQATVAAEMIAQMPPGTRIERVILPVGGGGLAAGVTHYFAHAAPDAQFTFVEPDNAPSLHDSLAQGERVTLANVDNFVDGAAVAQIGAHNFDLLKGFAADDVVLAPTGGLCATMLEMLNVEGVVLEPAGALAVDALYRLPAKAIEGKTVICVLSGGNFDFERLPDVKERAMKFSGLKKYFILRLPQRPGALKDFLFLLGPDDDIARFEYLKKSARNFGSVLIGIETSDPQNFASLNKRLSQSGMHWQDITENEIVGNLVL